MINLTATKPLKSKLSKSICAARTVANPASNAIPHALTRNRVATAKEATAHEMKVASGPTP